MLSGTGIRYCPFPGRIVGHPSLLRGSIEEITQSADGTGGDGRRGRLGPSGLPLRRRRGEAGAVGGCDGRIPVIAAGSVDSEEKIRTLADAGVWGFTVGSAIFEGKFAHHGASTREQVETVLAASRPVAS